jgi:integrase
MQPDTVRGPKRRDTGWKRDGKAKGIYWRQRADGTKAWGYYAWGKITAAVDRQQAIDAKAKAQVDKSTGRPAPNPCTLVSDLAEEVRETKRLKLRASSFHAFEYALDKVVIAELGQLRIGQVTPDRVASLIRELHSKGLKPTTVRRYLTPLSAIMRLAVRRRLIGENPLSLLSEDERPTGGGVRQHYEWSPGEISALIAAAEARGGENTARFNYGPLIHLLALTGMRVSEALGLRWGDVDLVVNEEIRVAHSLSRVSGELTAPKTKAGIRTIPLGRSLVDRLLTLKPVDAGDDEFVFASKRGARPVQYWNFRDRGFVPALEDADLAGKGITIHDLRSAAISLYAASGLSLVEVASIVGHSDATVTAKHYARLFDRSGVAARVRMAQEAISVEA